MERKFLGEKILKWYKENARILPWRENVNPYNIWICEIVLQQTQVKQGMNHYLRFVERFPSVSDLANADTDEVLLYWKGLGYYSRALNLHKAAQQIMTDFNGIFPTEYSDILKLKGVGKYTAAAIASICFGAKIPAVDGNFYRVLSRIFADEMDISTSSAFAYFSELALQIMPDHSFGDFNQAIMDIGSEVCKPKNPNCEVCPVNVDCLAFASNQMHLFPVKTKKVKVEELFLKYYFVSFENQFLIKQRNDDFIWKNLYEFPTEIPAKWQEMNIKTSLIQHKLTHKKLSIEIHCISMDNKSLFENFAKEKSLIITTKEQANQKSFPKPLEKYIEGF